VTRVRKLKINVGAGINPVPGLLLRGDDAKRLLVFAHGAGAGMEHPFMESMARKLDERGVATLRFDFPYMAERRKRPDHRNKLIQTVRAAVDRAREKEPDLPLFAGGKSMGGRMTSMAQVENPLPGVEGLVFFGFPLHAPGKDGDVRGKHLFDVEIPMLFLQGDRDSLANLEFLRPLVKKLGKRATLHVEEGADHGFHVLKRSGRTDEGVLDAIVGEASTWSP